jgi:SAM-dependent methyltransferase
LTVNHSDTNRRYWDALAAVHGQDAYYDTEALAGGASSLGELEEAAVREAVGDLARLDVLHIQCHIAHDAISLARRGARVAGADLSPAALAKARSTAERSGVELELVEADSQALPESLHGRFDLAYATIGVLCWIGDLDGWMRSAHAVLRPGGRLVLVDIHPLYMTMATVEPLALDFPYADDGPRRFDEEGSYADPDAKLAATASIQFGHSLGEIVTAALRAGLRVEALHEHLEVDRDPRGDMLARDDDGRYRLRISGEKLPILYTLIATRS